MTRVDLPEKPGYMLTRVLREQGLSQAEAARRTGWSPKHVSAVVTGLSGVTVNFAVDLERYLGVMGLARKLYHQR